MAAPIRLAIDAMSGDHGLSVTVPGALRALREHPDVELVLVGETTALEAALKGAPADLRRRLHLHAASEVVAMDESPSKALRNKKDSSMRVALDLLKQGEAQAVVSAGNTGALMATARFVLKMLPGVDRPAIISALPSQRGHTHMLDLGANAECSPEHLLQFAIMGSAMVAALDHIESPRVALLNIGEEEIKGNETIKAAAALLHASPLNYIGFVEGDGIFHADVDLVVTDGFVGNVALKTGEGVAKLVSHFLREAFTANALTRLMALAVKPILRRFADRVDPRLHNGASFVGLNGIVIKSHGGADELAFANAIAVGIRAVRQNLPGRISALLQDATAT